jgi:DNA-binding NarL/FixJ family response regulator
MVADPGPESDPDGLRIALLIADEPRRRELAAELSALGHSMTSLAISEVILTDDPAGLKPGIAAVLLSDTGVDAAGVLPREAGIPQIDAALHAVAAGLFVRPAPRYFDSDDNFSGPLLTPREIEILLGLRDGLSNKAIARRLDISQHTVKFHAESIFRKLGVTNRVEAVAKGLRRGLVHL